MKRFFDDIVKYYNYEVRSAKSSLKTEVANSYLNWIWWILDPLFSMMIYYLIFGVVFKAKEPYFTTFLFIGQTMWAFFNKNVVQSVKMIKRNKGIVSKVYIPKFVLLLSNMMVNGFKMAISCIIVVIMMIASKVELSTYTLCCIPILLVMLLVTFSISVNLMHFGVFIEDLGNVINIAMQLLFYMTGIFFSIDTRLGADYPTAARILTYANPMALLVRDMRNVLLYKQAPSWIALAVWGVIALILSIIGIRTIYKNENSYVKVI
ncbi:MAG: ABC transporter permease [Lachnospiraceae bacterium]|nr:ABC transporter permease [Lachnospiraceae bacterium]